MCRGKVKPNAQSAGGTVSHRAALSCLAPAVPCCTVTQNFERLIIIYVEEWADLTRLCKPKVSWTQVQWPQSKREGEVGKSGAALVSRHGEHLQGPLLTDLPASHDRPWQSSLIPTTDCMRSTSGPESSRQHLFLLVTKSGVWTRFQSIQTRDLSQHLPKERHFFHQ